MVQIAGKVDVEVVTKSLLLFICHYMEKGKIKGLNVYTFTYAGVKRGARAPEELSHGTLGAYTYNSSKASLSLCSVYYTYHYYYYSHHIKFSAKR